MWQFLHSVWKEPSCMSWDCISGLCYSKCHLLYFVWRLLLIVFILGLFLVILHYFHIFTSTRPLWTVRKWYLNKGFKGNLIFKDFYLSRHCSQNGIASSFYSFFYPNDLLISPCVVAFPFLVCLWCSSKICNDFHQRKHRGSYLL